MPVTIPVAEPTVATAGLLLLHVPPGVASVKANVEPMHTTQPDVGQEMGAGNGLTVIVVVTEQPEERVYVIVSIPGDIPITMPDAEPTVAIAGLLLLHVPPPGELLKVMVLPTHTEVGPVIAEGDE